MCRKKETMGSTEGYTGRLENLAEKIALADTVLIGAGAGLSASAGFTYSGKRFEEKFSDFIQKYGFQDMYTAGFYPYETLKEYWAYWSRYIEINRYREMTRQNPDAFYACINLAEEAVPEEIRSRSLCLAGDIGGILRAIAACDGIPLTQA